jgi:hypothetical protein
MEKSSIINDKEIANAVNFVVNKISKWTSAELAALALQNKQPHCIAISDKHYRVGKDTIKQIHETCWRLSNDQIVLDFMHKKSAIFYSLSQQLGKFDLAYSIMNNDQKLAANTADLSIFQIRIKEAVDNKDAWKAQLYLSRKKQAYSNCVAARTQLQKSLNLAKYYKIFKKII